MNLTKTILPVLIFLIGNYPMGFGQRREALKSIISIENQHLIAKVDNYFRIVAQQNRPVAISQLSATFQEYNKEKEAIEISYRNGFFMINPKTIGVVEIKISIGDTVETKILRVNPIEAVGRLGRYKANSDTKIGVAEFKAQLGISANIECCGFDARCRVLGFKMIRISNRNQVEKRVNIGGKYDEQTKKIIMKAESGDIYVFRQIKYRCSGAGMTQRLDDMIFEIK